MTRRSTPRCRQLGAEIVCLAGYMRLLTPRFVESWAGRMINIHPALLPSFRASTRIGGRSRPACACMAARCISSRAEMDDGPIIAQAAVPVLTGDSEADARRARAQGRAPALSAGAAAGRRGQGADGRRARGLRQLERRRQGRERAAVLACAPGSDELDLEALARFTP